VLEQRKWITQVDDSISICIAGRDTFRGLPSDEPNNWIREGDRPVSIEITSSKHAAIDDPVSIGIETGVQ